MSIEHLVKCRDAYQQLADTYMEEIERREPSEIQCDEKDFDKLFWETREGMKGTFQRTSKKATNNSDIFQLLQKVLKNHKGFMHLGGYQYWFDNNDPDVIDRRKK